MSRSCITLRLLYVLAALLCLFASSAFAAREIRGFTLTVSDLDKSVAFYQHALGFSKVSETVVADRDVDTLTGVFGTRVRSVRMRLGEEYVELEQYVAPKGTPIPADSRST